MEKTLAISVIVLVIALVALGVAILGYMQISATGTGVELTESPVGEGYIVKEFEGPIYTGTSNGFVIKFENGKVFYISGDTCLFSDMKWVIGDYYKPDVAFLPIGNVFTMDPKDAAFATTWVNPEYVIPYHFRIFPFLTQTTDEFENLVNQRRTNGETRAEPISLESGVAREIEGVKVTWLGHGTFFMESPTGTRMIIDPWFTPNPDTPATFKDMAVFGDVDLLLLTHGHLDHFDMDDMESIVEKYNPVILSQWEIMGYMQPKIPGQYLMMNKGGRITRDTLEKQGVTAAMPVGMEITMVQAEHSSSAP